MIRTDELWNWNISNSSVELENCIWMKLYEWISTLNLKTVKCTSGAFAKLYRHTTFKNFNAENIMKKFFTTVSWLSFFVVLGLGPSGISFLLKHFKYEIGWKIMISSHVLEWGFHFEKQWSHKTCRWTYRKCTIALSLDFNHM